MQADSARAAEPEVAQLRLRRNPWRYVRRSVRGKLIGIVLLTTTIVLLISGTAMLVHDLSVYRNSWAADVATEANILAVSAAPALAFDDQAAARRNLQALQTRSAVLAAALYAPDDRLYAQFVRPGEEPPLQRRPTHLEGLQVAGERVEFAQPIRYNNEYLGTLYLRAHYDVAGRVRTYLGIFALITIASFIAAFILSAALQRVITVPLEEIGRVAGRIVHEQDYSLRVRQTTEDEVGLVVQALNRMLREIDSRTQALRASNIALQDADQRKDEFLATLAHELRNPLAPIRHAARILEAPAATDAQRKWGREVIARQVEHMALLLEDLLDVSRITRGRLSLKVDPVSLQTIVAAAVETARPLLDSKHHSLHLDLPREPLELNVDSLRLSQALSNLLTNAVKYTDPGGRISVQGARTTAGVVIAVADNGIGLHESSLPNVFEMFSQVESALERSQGGLGIGLALVKGLVTLHGGTVEATSDGAGKGSTFTIRLPATCIVEAAAMPPLSGMREMPRPGATCKVLVADDNIDAAKSLAMLLTVSGHQVLVAHDGRTALELAQQEAPDACILDIGMPELSGYEVARAIRAQTRGASMLLIALTGWGQSEDVERALAAGFDHHFTKPVDAAIVEEKLILFCRNRAARRIASAAAER
jgi:two-component system, sensor histidine kinase